MCSSSYFVCVVHFREIFSYALMSFACIFHIMLSEITKFDENMFVHKKNFYASNEVLYELRYLKKFMNTKSL